MEIGIKGKKSIIVSKENTALKLGSGTLEVFATPAMISLIEKTAWQSIEEFLEEGQSTVGTSLRITHESASPIGMKIICETELIDIEKRKLTFKVEVFDQKGFIGRGIHERFIIDSEKFMNKANSKLEN